MCMITTAIVVFLIDWSHTTHASGLDYLEPLDPFLWSELFGANCGRAVMMKMIMMITMVMIMMMMMYSCGPNCLEALNLS
jgi:hypothetical protein